MTYRFAIWRLLFSWELYFWHVRLQRQALGMALDCALICAAIASACARVDYLRGDCPVVRWHVKLRQAGATLWALGALAANVGGV